MHPGNVCVTNEETAARTHTHTRGGVVRGGARRGGGQHTIKIDTVVYIPVSQINASIICIIHIIRSIIS